MRLSEELARILPGRRPRVGACAAGRSQAPREIVPSSEAGRSKAERLDAARERLRRQNPPRADDDQ